MGDSAKTNETAQKNSFFKGLKSEFKKIVWPDKDTLAKQTAGVIVVTVALGIIISVIDLGIKFGFDKILQLG